MTRPSTFGWLARAIAVSALVGFVLAGAVPAVALTRGFAHDPNDVAGRLDLRSLTVSKPEPNAPLRIRVRTYGPWTVGRLSGTGGNRIRILFDTDADPSVEFFGKITESGGKLTLTITGKGSSFEPLRVRHPNSRTITTVIPGNAPMNPRGRVLIAAARRRRVLTRVATASRTRSSSRSVERERRRRPTP